ncbi:VIT1/CCC1 transporter family protein [Corynebacterium endometrii]|uniref:VIT family protein n=1 Tax=Corynebacterium endometrii TaxID=2488819 RepID=A0A4P7QGP6_9CORY|nr:VIT1/CCC1 transporter family protein [Corynebacterium endometrii]QCB28951.1 VIT family protein [Corynebacterium endometrii]
MNALAARPAGEPHHPAGPTKKQIQRWRQYLANERAEAAVYRELARKKEGEERQILLELADSESRHEEYWREKLGDEVGAPLRADLNTRMLGFMARHFGSVFALALMQSAEARSPYWEDEDASEQIAADERVHAEVVRALATRGREKMSGNFRAAVFGANDGLVSNLALVIGVMGSGVSSSVVLLTGISGLLAGALSMAAGEYISVKSQAELLEASKPAYEAPQIIGQLDLNANELELVYRARGMNGEAARAMAAEMLHFYNSHPDDVHEAHAHMVKGMPGMPAHASVDSGTETDDHAVIGEARFAALSSFLFFGTGAFIPIIPFIFGMGSGPGAVVALILVSIALMFTGGVVGVISGKPPLGRALRQLAIGLGAAGITYLLGLAFGGVVA